MTLGLGSVSTWPQSLSNTTVTQSFQVQGYDANALNGFIRSSSLKTLILAETNLVNLSYLNCEKSFNFSSLSDMFLRNNERLDVDSLFQCNGTLHLQQISIRGSHLQSIPFGLSRLGSLLKIDLSNNSITTIGDSDLKGLVNLEQLFISHNPIESISLHAFDNNVHLSTVQFLDTALSTFPLAVTSLQSRPLNLAFTYPMYVQCRCDVLSDLAQINGTKTLNRIYCISQATIDVPTAFDDILSKCP
ncbi:leucine-rich repeat-containing G-protein coupled receptor 4-like [Mya arenaria]|nr:leucine-rich repeat-containing G-protein coupled receptor 4-like [Mya arenaria]